jgi:hypothetical protein
MSQSNAEHARLAVYAGAMGLALDCLADECSLAQLTSARVACDEADAGGSRSAAEPSDRSESTERRRALEVTPDAIR